MVLGYPTTPPFDGTAMRACGAGAVGVLPADERFVQVRCDLTGGASGGPWLSGLTDDGVGTVVAVSSFTPIDRGGTIAGIPLGRAAHDLWLAANRAP